MRRFLVAVPALAGILLLCLPACSTLTMTGSGEKLIMGGTRENCQAFEPDRVPPHLGHAVPVVAFLDFPCSLALDLVLLPITIPVHFISGEKPCPGPPWPPREKDAERPK